MSEKQPALTGPEAEAAMRRLSRRSFLTGGVAALAGVAGWTWLQTTSKEDGIPWPLRRMLRFNESLVSPLVSPNRLAPEFPREQVDLPARFNGRYGLASEKDDLSSRRLRLQYPDGSEKKLTLDEIKGLPRREMVVEFKCVEGWSRICHFAGVSFADFAAKYQLPTNLPYVYMATPKEGYYVGLDMASAMHPQTLLCDTMNGEPLTAPHGAPLRLAMTVKYAYKQIKNIDMIRCQDERPPDYWAERSFDWFGGL
jgi:DMSO/TMAO reductase YedYZ molybdopterin-dependent catalytic subunit